MNKYWDSRSYIIIHKKTGCSGIATKVGSYFQVIFDSWKKYAKQNQPELLSSEYNKECWVQPRQIAKYWHFVGKLKND